MNTSKIWIALLSLSLLAAWLGGWSGGSGSPKNDPKRVFTLAWSEYPSWSVFGVMADLGHIDPREGRMGRIEAKWNIDIVMKEADYDASIQMYASSSCDAVCITNMDVLNVARGRDSVAILPTSTSVGADACVVVGINDVRELRSHKVYGLAKSVSEYCFARTLETLGENESDYVFSNMDPGAAAQALQTNQSGYRAIMVWNPYVLQTLKTNKDAKVLFSSSLIPNEIIDMVVVAQESLNRPGGDNFANAIIDMFYEFNQMLSKTEQREKLLVALGAKFSHLNAVDMEQVLEESRFYARPSDAITLLDSPDFQGTMNRVADFSLKHGIVETKPEIQFGGAELQKHGLRFDTSFLRKFEAAQK